MEIDIQRIVENSVVALLSGGASWVLASVWKLKKDLNRLWGRVRYLENKVE